MDYQEVSTVPVNHIQDFIDSALSSQVERAEMFDVTVGNCYGKVRGKCCIGASTQAFEILGMDLPFAQIVDIVVLPAPITLFSPDRETLAKITFITKPE